MSGLEDHSLQGFLKVGICIDVETLKKERVYWVSVHEGYQNKLLFLYIWGRSLKDLEMRHPEGWVR